jgi:hypothetical protein
MKLCGAIAHTATIIHHFHEKAILSFAHDAGNFRPSATFLLICGKKYAILYA